MISLEEWKILTPLQNLHNCCPRLCKVAQSAIKWKIWSHCCLTQSDGLAWTHLLPLSPQQQQRRRRQPVAWPLLTHSLSNDPGSTLIIVSTTFLSFQQMQFSYFYKPASSYCCHTATLWWLRFLRQCGRCFSFSELVPLFRLFSSFY